MTNTWLRKSSLQIKIEYIKIIHRTNLQISFYKIATLQNVQTINKNLHV